MSFPSYKTITINSHQKRLIYSQLDQLDFGYFPYIFELNHLSQNQNEAIENIENYFFEHEINVYSYPIVILSDVQRQHDFFYLTDDKKNIPKFFKFKSKQLSTKEAQKLKFVELKQVHLNNISRQEFEPILEEYARTHKIINKLYNEKVFYERLAQKLHIL